MSKFENDQFKLHLEKKLIELPETQDTPVNKSMTEFINIFESNLQLHAPLHKITYKEKN